MNTTKYLSRRININNDKLKKSKKKNMNKKLVNKINKTINDKTIKSYKLRRLNINDDKKKKKKSKKINYTKLRNIMEFDDKKKKKKITEQSKQYIKQKNELSNENIPKVMGLEISSRNYNWGFGVEHEMQLFHVPTKKLVSSDNKNKDDNLEWKYGNILFDSQESTCFLTGDMDAAGSCCKKRGINCSHPYYFPNNKDRLKLLKASGKKDDDVSKEELEWLKAVDWELTGRQIRDCQGGNWVVKRTPILMPELITGNHKNRTVESMVKEIQHLTNKFIDLQMRNPLTRRKVQLYGELRPHMCGTLSNILVPERPTIFNDEYLLSNVEQFKDYLGSYHVTITLPHRSNISVSEFVKSHLAMGMAFQWLEPLFMAAFFSPDPDSVGSEIKRIKGSYRVMAVGWGNMGGSNLSVLEKGDEGLTRAANHKLHWRDIVKFNDSEKLNLCVKTGTPNYKKSIIDEKDEKDKKDKKDKIDRTGIHMGDLRTFNFAKDMESCEKLYNPADCPKIDGGLLEPPYGMELRIFDHFENIHLKSLLHIIILLAENGNRHKPTQYVYKDNRWISSMKSIMENGWNGRLTNDYINALRDNLGLQINTTSKIAWIVFKIIVKELHELNKNGLFVKLMIENPDTEPNVPQINRNCWELALKSSNHYEAIKRFLQDKYKNRKSVLPIKQFKKEFFNVFSSKIWNQGTTLEDVLYCMKSNNIIDLIHKGDNIIAISIK